VDAITFFHGMLLASCLHDTELEEPVSVYIHKMEVLYVCMHVVCVIDVFLLRW